MAQFGNGGPNKVPPWQRAPQQLTSLLGQHPNASMAAASIAGQLVMTGQQQQTGQPPPQQYAPVQQSMIQAPGLANLQSLAPQGMQQTPQNGPNIGGMGGQGTPPQGLVQNSLAQTSLMGQPPMTQPLQQLQQQTLQQQALQQQQQQQAQVATVQYPAPRALAPPSSFPNLPNTLTAPPGMGLPPTSTHNLVSQQTQAQQSGQQQQPQKQRVFTGTITKLCADFGFVDDDVFFQTSCVIGQPPSVNDRVLVEATFNPTMPFKWNANRVQVIPGPNRESSSSHRSSSNSNSSSRQSGGNAGGSRLDSGYNAVPPPSFNSAVGERRSFRDSGSSSYSSNRTRRSRSPRRDNHSRRDRERDRDRDDPKEMSSSGNSTSNNRNGSKDKEVKRKRTRSRERSRSPRSPARRRPRVLPRYNVQVPKLLLPIEEASILELRKRYSNLYIPSDVFVTRPLWSNTFPAYRPFPIPKPVSFHIMHKDVESVLPNDAVYDPPDVSHSYAAKVMLLSVPSMEEIYKRSCALSEDSSDSSKEGSTVHPTRLINFCVGLKGKNETMAVGGYWSPSLDGASPDKDPQVLIKTAIRTCLALTGIDLSPCTTWYRFAEIYYRRAEPKSGGGVGRVVTAPAANNSVSSRVETTVLFMPDVWNITPTKLEWDGLHLNYKRQLDKKLASLPGVTGGEREEPEADEEEEEETDVDQEKRPDPTHWSSLDTKVLKVVELRRELDARLLNSKGLRSQLVARLAKALKAEQEKEEADKLAIEEKMKTDEVLKREEEDKRREEEKKKRDEDDKKKEEEEKRRNLEKEVSLMEKRHTLPESPMILVHPSRSAKGGKFDATTMSLSVLLDYRQEDNKEHSFEVSLFAELFNEMLMRDFAFRIYRALVDAPDKLDEKKKETEKKKEEETKDKKEEEEKKEKKEDAKKEVENTSVKRENEECEENVRKRRRRDKFKNENDQKDEDDEAILDLDFEYEEEEFFKDDAKADEDKKKEEEEKSESNNKETSKEEKKDSSRSSRSNGDAKKKSNRNNRTSSEDRKEKRKMFTHNPYLLLAFIYFDTTRTGYIVDRDLEDIINLLGLNLSRAQLKTLTSKVVSRDCLHYRKLTDAPLEDREKMQSLTKEQDTTLLETLARGNKCLLSEDSSLSSPNKRSPRRAKSDDSPKLKEGVVRYEGSLVDVAKLMQQLQRSEKALVDTEEKLKLTQKEFSAIKDENKSLSEKNSRLNKEVKNHLVTSRSTEDELQKSMEDNFKYMTALNKIKEVVKPLVKGLELELDDDMEVKSESKIKTEDVRTNGNK